MNQQDLRVVVDLPGRDRIEAHKQNNIWKVVASGCQELLESLRRLQATGEDPSLWVLPNGNNHSDLLLRELILKVRGEWVYPYQHEELCHCRSVATEIVDQAILAGAHTTSSVSARTSASTACGTCRPDVQKILSYRLGS